MDLRIVKTRARIKEAFLTLRHRLTPDKIKVKDICAMARINKTTFYKHYNDSMELSREIDEQAIDHLVEQFAERERLVDDPRAYIMGLLNIMSREAPTLRILFQDKREELFSKLSDRLSAFVTRDTEELEEGVRLTFAIGGAVRVAGEYILEETRRDIGKVVDTTVCMLEALVPRRRAAAQSTN